MAEDTARPRPSWGLQTTLVPLGTLALVVALGRDGGHAVSPDADSYIAMARGRFQDAFGPFSSRFLHPLIVFLLSRSGLSTERSFELVAILSVAAFFLVALALWRRHSISTLLLFSPAVLLLAPWFVEFFRMYYHAELFHAAVCGLFFLALPTRPRLSLLILFVLFLVRESTILLALSVAAVALGRGRPRFALATLGVAVLGWTVTSRVAAYAQPNIHHLGAALYLVAKVFHQFCSNILGLAFVVDKHAFYNEFTPKYVFNLPHWGILGGITKLAFVRFDARGPLETALAALTTFGIFPLLFLRAGLFARFRQCAPAESIALLYGTLCFVTAPLLGNAISRYISYGWPALFIAAPALLPHFLPSQRWKRVAVSCVHLAICWLPEMFRGASPSLFRLAILVIVALLLNYFGYRLLTGYVPPAASNAAETDSQALVYF